MTFAIMAYLWCLTQSPKYRCDADKQYVRMALHRGTTLIARTSDHGTAYVLGMAISMSRIGAIELTNDHANISRDAMSDDQKGWFDRYIASRTSLICNDETRDDLESAILRLLVDWKMNGYTSRTLKRLRRVEQLTDKLMKC